MKVFISYSIIHLFLLVSCITDKPVNDVEKKVVFHDNEKLPKFIGGLDSLNSWINKEVRYPNTVVNEGINKEVIIRFFIDSLGNVSDANVLKSSSNKEFDNEALRLVKSMPKWEKGTIGAYFNLPIVFIENKENR